MKLAPLDYPNDTNLLSFLFTVARNDYLFHNILLIINFIRDHPNMTERQVRKELRRMPVEANESQPKPR